jgi:hypothetical protein
VLTSEKGIPGVSWRQDSIRSIPLGAESKTSFPGSPKTVLTKLQKAPDDCPLVPLVVQYTHE